jgi:integrase
MAGLALKLSRRGAGVFYLTGTVGGERFRKSTGTRSRQIAEAIRVRTETELLERTIHGPKAFTTFAEAALLYMDAGGEVRFLGPLLEHFGPEAKISQIGNREAQSAAAAIYPNAAPATLNRQVITPISAVITMAAEEGLTEFKKFRCYKVDQVRTRWLRPEEAERLIDAASPDLLPKIGLLLGAGLRVAEACALMRADLHLASGEAWIAETKNGTPRMVRFPSRARDLITAQALFDEGAVLRTPRGKAYTPREGRGGHFGVAFRAARIRAGLGADVTPHVLRHTWATWFYCQTLDYGALMDLGGWRKADMANRYRKTAPRHLAEDLRAHGWHFDRAPDRAPLKIITARD